MSKEIEQRHFAGREVTQIDNNGIVGGPSPVLIFGTDKWTCPTGSSQYGIGSDGKPNCEYNPTND